MHEVILTMLMIDIAWNLFFDFFVLIFRIKIAHSEFFKRSSFRLTVLMVISWTVENKEAPSAKSFGLDCKPFDSSFIYTKSNKSSKIYPCSTPGFTFIHDNNWPLKAILCWQFFTKFIKRHSNLSLLLFCFNLYIIPLCHTLSEAIDMSRNTPLTSY